MEVPTTSEAYAAPGTGAGVLHTAVAPARVNLIGEHTDYTGGLVLPIAIPFFTKATISAGRPGFYRISSTGFDGVTEMPVNDRSGPTHAWSDYPVGVLRELQAGGLEIPSFALHLTGDIPLGAGLSSSASIEVATAYALLAHATRTLPAEEIALLCQRAENNFVGSPSGIMDQFIVTAGKNGYALLLETRDLRYQLLPLNSGELMNTRVVIANSTVRHAIAGGDYGLRRREVEAGQSVLLRRFPHLRDLGDATVDQLTEVQHEMSPESLRRCRHIISENLRVRAAADAMLAGDPVALGLAMQASHWSQRDDFQVSVPEIDLLVEAALLIDGCFGARLTGGGFGGCTVNLVSAERAEAFRTELKESYRERFGIDAPVYICGAVDGAARRNAAQGVGETA